MNPAGTPRSDKTPGSDKTPLSGNAVGAGRRRGPSRDVARRARQPRATRRRQFIRRRCAVHRQGADRNSPGPTPRPRSAESRRDKAPAPDACAGRGNRSCGRGAGGCCLPRDPVPRLRRRPNPSRILRSPNSRRPNHLQALPLRRCLHRAFNCVRPTCRECLDDRASNGRLGETANWRRSYRR